MARFCLIIFTTLILTGSFLTQGFCAEDAAEQKKEKAVEQKNEKTAEHKLDEITVSDKSVAPITSRYAVPESSKIATEVITAEEIKQMNPQTIFDILQFVPGMEVTFQGREHLNMGNMRGVGNYGFIIDGVYIVSPDRILATFPVETIESIRVVRDATALLLGPLTNFGGVNSATSNQGFVVITTKRASKLEGGALADYGSFKTQKEQISLGDKIGNDKIGNFDVRATYTYRDSPGKTNWYNGYRDQSGLFRGGYTKEGGVNADVMYYTSRGMRELERGELSGTTTTTINKKTYIVDVPGDGNQASAKWRFNPLQTDMVALNVTKPWTATQTTAFSASYTNVTLNKEQSTFPLQSPVTVVDQDIRGYQVDLRHTAEFFKNNLFKIGGQMLSQTSPTGLAPSTGMRTETDMYSLFMWDQHSMFDKKLTFDGGIRMDKKYFGDNDINGTPLHEWSKEIYTYAAGIAYKPIQMLTLTGRYAYSENTPASYQVDAATRSTLPGERRNRYEGGILANFHPAFNPWATLFYYDVKNQLTNTGYYIDSTGNEVNTYTTSNVRYKGVELGFSGQLMKCLSYNLNYTYATSDSEAVNLAIAQHMASGRITYKWKGFDTNLMVRYVGSTNTSSSPAGTQLYSLGDYTRVDANIGYNFKVFERAAKFMVYGQNLGDVHYATRIVSNALYKDPGRVIGARMTISFF